MLTKHCNRHISTHNMLWLGLRQIYNATSLLCASKCERWSRNWQKSFVLRVWGAEAWCWCCLRRTETKGRHSGWHRRSNGWAWWHWLRDLRVSRMGRMGRKYQRRTNSWQRMCHCSEGSDWGDWTNSCNRERKQWHRRALRQRQRCRSCKRLGGPGAQEGKAWKVDGMDGIDGPMFGPSLWCSESIEHDAFDAFSAFSAFKCAECASDGGRSDGMADRAGAAGALAQRRAPLLFASVSPMFLVLTSSDKLWQIQGKVRTTKTLIQAPNWDNAGSRTLI